MSSYSMGYGTVTPGGSGYWLPPQRVELVHVLPNEEIAPVDGNPDADDVYFKVIFESQYYLVRGDDICHIEWSRNVWGKPGQWPQMISKKGSCFRQGKLSRDQIHQMIKEFCDGAVATG